MSKKQQILDKLRKHTKITNLISTSMDFWKNDLKLKNIPDPCFCSNKENIDELPQQKEKPMEEIPIPILKNKILIQQNIFKISHDQIENKKKYNDWNSMEDRLLLKLNKGKLHKRWKKISEIIGNNKTPRMCNYRIKKLTIKTSLESKVSRKNLMKIAEKQMITKTKTNGINKIKWRIRTKKGFLKNSGINERNQESNKIKEFVENDYDLSSFNIKTVPQELIINEDQVFYDNKNSNSTDFDIREPYLKNGSENFFSRKNSPDDINMIKKGSDDNLNDFKSAFEIVFAFPQEKKINEEFTDLEIIQQNFSSEKTSLIDSFFKKAESLLKITSEQNEIKNRRNLDELLTEIKFISKSLKNPYEIKKLMLIHTQIVWNIRNISNINTNEHPSIH